MISSQSPHTDIWLLPNSPVNTWLYQEWFAAGHLDTSMPKRAEVEALNAFIKTLAVDRPLIHFVDVPELLDRTGELGEDYTVDGLHLNGRGLKKIAARLQQSWYSERELAGQRKR
jgi:lysophospholipase L1-like esterase